MPKNIPSPLWTQFLDTFRLFSKRREYCFESTVSEKRTHWASLSFGANSVSSAKNSVSLLCHTNSRLRGTHWVLSPELGECKKTHWARCSTPYSPKPYSANFSAYLVTALVLQICPTHARCKPSWRRPLRVMCLKNQAISGDLGAFNGRRSKRQTHQKL